MAARQAILVTGGAGYIGSHTCRHLIDAGFKVVIVDNLYSGHRWAIPESARFIEGDAGDRELVERLLRDNDIGSVIHFAGHIVVPESVRVPMKYYRNNVGGMTNLLTSCLETGVKRFVFSSSAAVYGMPTEIPVREDAPTLPINPYGTSKLMAEWMLRDISRADGGFRYVALRYFNVAGARPDGTLGQATREATHLIKVACQAACAERDHVDIYGTDYSTPDGTCMRDYIHVEDLAAAHVAALRYLEGGGGSTTLNCGYGRGFSVRQVLETVKSVSGIDFEVREAPRRAGDPPALIVDIHRIHEVLGWEPEYNDLGLICRTAYKWEKRLLGMSD